MLLNNLFSYLYKKRSEETDTIKKSAYSTVLNCLENRCSYSIESARNTIVSEQGYCSYLKSNIKRGTNRYKFLTEVINLFDSCLSLINLP